MTAKISPLSIVVMVLICIGAIIAIFHFHPPGEGQDVMDWNLTLVSNGEVRVLSLDDIKAMHSYEGYGGFFTTVGVVNGPYRCKGVPIEELCDLVGGLNASNTLLVSARDGYLMTFGSDQARGHFRTYDPQTFREVPHEELEMILMYEVDGAPLTDYGGRPLRIAIVHPEDEGTVTEGHNWVKWVDKIEIRTPSGA